MLQTMQESMVTVDRLNRIPTEHTNQGNIPTKTSPHVKESKTVLDSGFHAMEP